ncbi:winged helix-turn-helix transcriptional regulator [Chitinophaga nivalis]|uniref:Helix-turn-helix transcriptional regulator n=1 Tax=Chitinophaga nivalis TaxID=2991709 RepID=A0ABT3IPE4_9BACT|nr:helix-turn-helix domain-containing protein [Chitinophaga nivalis]MCW3464487.1 helix-turn-helix transcriptional regulator [Chitinophaga nivalis]MCW3485822.1 helix-turn-helix transcriptional regulator [Chitinophaga nivalis]
MALQEMEKMKKMICPFQEAMDLISGKWTMSIINTLMGGKMRFKELERSVVGINTRMLVKELKQLESRKIIHREAFATVPPTVEYTLTEKGLTLKPVLMEIQGWAMKHMEK